MTVIRMSLVFFSSLCQFGCAHDGPGLRMMNDRAEYDDLVPETSELNLEFSGALGEAGQLKQRPEPRVAQIWVHPQRISNREHFWGAWISVRLEDEQWEAQSLDQFEQAAPKSRPKDDGSMRKRR